MYAVMGISGQVGGAVAKNLLANGNQVRALVRDERKAGAWIGRGCEAVIADINDSRSLEKAFAQTAGVFVMLPPIFDPQPGFPEAHEAIQSLCRALLTTRPAKIVCLSTIGGHVARPNLLNQLHELESKLGSLPLAVTFLRPAWFMENASWDLKTAAQTGVISSFLQPLDKPVPMIATQDVGQFAAELLLNKQMKQKVLELEHLKRITPNEIAVTLSDLLGKTIRMDVVPRDQWESLFRSQGMKNPIPRMQMLDGFNEGWIEFEREGAESRKGETTLKTVLCSLIKQQELKSEN
jgi:NAD(P)H dehydrogenase (quinone)